MENGSAPADVEPDDLRERVIAELPARSVALLEEIEQFSGKTIGFKKYPYPPDPGAYNQSPCATAISCVEADILLYNTDEPSALGVTHELLHLHRYWVRSVPRFFPAQTNAQAMENCNTFENAIEHLIVVPRERDFGFNGDFWAGVLQYHIDAYPWAAQKDPLARRRHSLMVRMSAELVDDNHLKGECQRLLKLENIDYEADLFAKLLKNLLGDKVRAAGLFARFFKFPKGAYVLLQCDVRNGTSRRIAIPAH